MAVRAAPRTLITSVHARVDASAAPVGRCGGNTNTNTKCTCGTGQARNKLLEQWVHLTNRAAVEGIHAVMHSRDTPLRNRQLDSTVVEEGILTTNSSIGVAPRTCSATMLSGGDALRLLWRPGVKCARQAGSQARLRQKTKKLVRQ